MQAEHTFHKSMWGWSHRLFCFCPCFCSCFCCYCWCAVIVSLLAITECPSYVEGQSNEAGPAMSRSPRIWEPKVVGVGAETGHGSTWWITFCCWYCWYSIGYWCLYVCVLYFVLCHVMSFVHAVFPLFDHCSFWFDRSLVCMMQLAVLMIVHPLTLVPMVQVVLMDAGCLVGWFDRWPYNDLVEIPWFSSSLGGTSWRDDL